MEGRHTSSVYVGSTQNLKGLTDLNRERPGPLQDMAEMRELLVTQYPEHVVNYELSRKV